MKLSLYCFLNTDTLRHRDTAKLILNKILKDSHSGEIILDFKNITFASRSFLHELLSQLSDIPDVRFINMNPTIKQMKQMVYIKPVIHFNKTKRLKTLVV